jgi:hypothetical protein
VAGADGGVAFERAVDPRVLPAARVDRDVISLLAAGDAAARCRRIGFAGSAPANNTWVYTYDHDDRMTSAAYSATDGGAVTVRVAYNYDVFGNRIERDVWKPNGASVERFAYDGRDTVKPEPVGNEEFDAWADLSGAKARARSAWRACRV